MIVDFSNANVKEPPLLILQNLDDTPIGVLKYAFNVEAELYYNEISTLTFDLPGYIEGKKMSNYSRVIGMRVVDLKGYGRFLLQDPKENDDGVRLVKSCTAYSLEYEFTLKKLALETGTYNLWNPVASKGTILGLILEKMPSWSIGSVDASLIDRYRTFDDSGDQNIYNFMKSDLQAAYGCVFDFDTYNRLIYVRDIEKTPNQSQVLFSMENLVKEVSVEEDTEGIFTSLNVYGAEGIDIRSVNPMGTTNLINLDYFMTLDHFSQSIIDKYQNWKRTFKSYQRQYFNLTVEEALKTTQLLTEQAALTTLQGELAVLENAQAVVIQAIAQGLKTQQDLDAANSDIRAKQNEITAKEGEISAISTELAAINQTMLGINATTKLSAFFTAAEYKIIDRYLKEDSITDDSFVAIELDAFDSAGESMKLTGSIFNLTSGTVTMSKNTSGADIYSMSGGQISCSISGFNLSANLIRASIDYETNKDFLFTAYINKGTLNGHEVPSGCISISGTAQSVTSNTQSSDGVIFEGTNISFKIGTANLYFTQSTTEYEKRAVEWDLLDYGEAILERAAYPSYTISLDIVNFLALQEFEPFKNNLCLGAQLYWKQRDGTIFTPYLIGVKIPFENLENFSVELSSRYSSKSGQFDFKDLIEDAKTAGATLDSGKWSYSQFVNSGAETSLSKFMSSALDIAKNNIISSFGQAISWGESGARFRKWKNAVQSLYEPYEIWINNASIMFTTDNWNTANLAIGQVVAEDGSTVLSGVVAESLIGKLIAGNSLIIESAKKDGGIAVFRVDGNGASLHNAVFDLYNGNKTHVTLNPYTGFAIGEYPIYKDSAYTIDTDKAKFWVDVNGNVHIKGTLEGCDGKFSGSLEAATGTFAGELSAATGTFSGIVKAASYQDLNGNNMMTAGYKFSPDYLELKGLNVNDNFIVSSAGEVTIRGNITMLGGSIKWSEIDETESDSYKKAEDAADAASDAADAAEDAADAASDAKKVAEKIANGTYSGGTFIDGKSIYSPKIYANKFSVIPEPLEDGDTPNTTENNPCSYSLYGYFLGQLREMLNISYYYAGVEPRVVFKSPCSAYATWGFGNTSFSGYVDFSGATVNGIDATFG